MSGFNKNAIVTSSSFSDFSGVAVKQPTTIKYTPTAGVQNSCMETQVTGLTEGETYVVSMILSWSFTSFPTNFTAWYQGSQQHKTSGWGWTHGSTATDGLNSVVGDLAATAKSSPTFSKKVVYEFTCPTNYIGFAIGCRCDYADGTSWIEMRDITVVPKKYYVGTTSAGKKQAIKIKSDEIIFTDIIEY